MRGDATGGDDRKFCCGAELAEVIEVCAGHGAFAIDVGAEKSGAVGFQLRNYGAGLELKFFAPALGEDLAFCGVERDDDFLPPEFVGEGGEEFFVDAAVFESAATDDDLRGSCIDRGCGPSKRADAAADADFQFVVARGFGAEGANEFCVRSLVHRGIEVDDMQPFVIAEFVEKAEYVGDSQFAAPAVDELYGLSVLQIDAGN